MGLLRFRALIYTTHDADPREDPTALVQMRQFATEAELELCRPGVSQVRMVIEIVQQLKQVMDENGAALDDELVRQKEWVDHTRIND